MADPGARKLAEAILLQNSTLVAAASHWFVLGGDGVQAEAITTSEAQVRGVGKSIVEISASWDWSSYGSDHPCAIVDTAPHWFATGNLPNGLFDTTATVTIRRPGTSAAITSIRGESSDELETDLGPPVCTANEFMIAFTITGGTSKYSSASGSGSIRSLVNGCAATAEESVIVRDLPLRIERK